MLLREPEDEPVPGEAEQHHGQQAAEHAQPHPEGDPADLAAAGDQLGGAGQDEGHQEQGHGTAEAHAGQRDVLGGALGGARSCPRGAGLPNPGEETGGMSGLSGRLAATVQYHQSHPSQPSRRAGGAPGVAGRAVPSRAWQNVPDATPSGADEPGYDWLYGTRRKGVGGATPPGADDATQVQPPSPRRRPVGSAGPGTHPDAADRRPAREQRAPPRGSLRDAPAGPSSLERRLRRCRSVVAPSRPPAVGPSRGRRRSRFGWVKIVLAVWLVFLVAVPLIAWSKIEKVDATPSGDRPDGAARDDVPPGRQ